MAFAFAAPLVEAVAGGAAAEGAAAAGTAGGTAAGGATAGGAARTFTTGFASHFAGGHSESRGEAAPAAPGAATPTNPVFN